jgi:hypothetical protein
LSLRQQPLGGPFPPVPLPFARYCSLHEFHENSV